MRIKSMISQMPFFLRRSFPLLFILPFLIYLNSCSAVPICPIPIAKYAPKVEPLAEHEEIPLAESTLSSNNKDGTRSALMAMRGGRGICVRPKRFRKGFLKSLPPPKLKLGVLEFYVPPPRFSPPKAGDKHYFNFEVTPKFEEASNLYLCGKGDEAIKVADQMLANPNDDPKLKWQASYLKVMILSMMGRNDLAEKETRNLEKLENIIMGSNFGSWAVRAEIRYWAGDIDGAITDVVPIINALGDWRFPTTYNSPPLDQVNLANITASHVRATMILGLALVAKDLYEDAIPWLELANQTMNNVMFVNRHPLYGLYFPAYQELFYDRGLTLAALGMVLMSQNPDSKRAQEMFEHAQEYFDAMGYLAGKVLAKAFKTQALLVAGRYEDVVEQAGAGLELAEKAELLNFIWRLELQRGQALIKLDRWKEAEKSFRRAQTVVDLISGTMATDKAKVRFGAGKEAITENLVKIDIRKKDFDTLFKDLERGHARAFVAMMANRVVASGREQKITAEIRELDRKILVERQKKNAIASKINIETNHEIAFLKKRVALVAKLRQRDPELADAFAVSAIELKDVQACLADGQVIIYTLPVTGNEPICLMFISSKNVHLETLDLNVSELRANIEAFTQSIMETDIVTQNATIEILRKNLKIAKWGKFRSAYVVPSGDFHFIPWAAFDIDFPISVLPIGGWVVRTPKTFKGSTKQASLIGDPYFGGLLPQLPGAQLEAETVARLYNTNPLIGKKATEENLRSDVGEGVKVLHFATHAIYDPVYPLQSSLILTDGSKAFPLTAEKLFKNPIQSHLVVLSACETGMGQVISGDDLLGLTRSFYMGGAHSVVSSLWPVADKPTQIFMNALHENLRSGDIGKAWLIARDVVKEKGFPPSAYGAFNLGGKLHFIR